VAETIEKITRSDPPKKGSADYSVTEKIILRRASFRFLLAILILSIYAFTIYSLMYHPSEMDDKTSTLLVSVIGALTVLISQIGSFMYGDPKSDTSENGDNKKEKEADARPAA
jgi:p-aminobenzoyl-glutamate transporter AbgT